MAPASSYETIPGLSSLENIPNLGALLTKLLAETGIPTNGVTPIKTSQQNEFNHSVNRMPDLRELSPIPTVTNPYGPYTAMITPGRPTARGMFPRLSSERTGLPGMNMSVPPPNFTALTGNSYKHEDIKPPKPDFHIFKVRDDNIYICLKAGNAFSI